MNEWVRVQWECREPLVLPLPVLFPRYGRLGQLQPQSDRHSSALLHVFRAAALDATARRPFKAFLTGRRCSCRSASLLLSFSLNGNVENRTTPYSAYYGEPNTIVSRKGGDFSSQSLAHWIRSICATLLRIHSPRREQPPSLYGLLLASPSHLHAQQFNICLHLGKTIDNSTGSLLNCCGFARLYAYLPINKSVLHRRRLQLQHSLTHVCTVHPAVHGLIVV